MYKTLLNKLHFALTVVLIAVLTFSFVVGDLQVNYTFEDGAIEIQFDNPGLDFPAPQYQLVCEGGASGSCGGG